MPKRKCRKSGENTNSREKMAAVKREIVHSSAQAQALVCQKIPLARRKQGTRSGLKNNFILKNYLIGGK